MPFFQVTLAYKIQFFFLLYIRGFFRNGDVCIRGVLIPLGVLGVISVSAFQDNVNTPAVMEITIRECQCDFV